MGGRAGKGLLRQADTLWRGSGLRWASSGFNVLSSLPFLLVGIPAASELRWLSNYPFSGTMFPRPVPVTHLIMYLPVTSPSAPNLPRSFH